MVAPAAPSVAQAAEADGDAVGFVVVRENGSGSASSAQSYLDTLLTSIAQRNGWASATGKYFTKRSKAKAYIEQTKPSFGFLSFGAYLGLRKASGLRPLAVADAGLVGGAQYFVISRNQFTLDGCKGKTLASNHASDGRFVDAVVSGDAFDLSDFTLVTTRRPVQTIKAVIDGEAECALVDDAQIVAMANVEGGALLRPVWSSAELPAVVLVSFGSAPAEQVSTFEGNIDSLCEGEGRKACDAAGLQAPHKVAKDAFAAHEAAYDG
ncbi:MAG: hypothetical protein KDK70_10495 [Myxococcales bacterium]|nr:hypothetical protein [Myxococcales bacterium]